MKIYFLFPLLLLSACAGLPPSIANAPATEVSYQQVSLDANSFKDVPVRWGGVIIDVDNEEHDSMLQIVSYPLDYTGRPQVNRTGEGRFVVKSSEFLDPAVYAKDKEITIAGVITGDTELTVGKRIIRVPLLNATAIYLWPKLTNYNYYSPYYGPYPYYPGYYPLYRGGFYGPFFRW